MEAKKQSKKERKQMGRKSQGLGVPYGLRLTPEQSKYVKRVSQMSKQSAASYIRDLIEMEMQMQSTPVRYDSASASDYTFIGRCKQWLMGLFL